MWKIQAPNKDHYGPIGSAQFAGGTATTQIQHEAEWFARHKFTVTPLIDGLPDVNPPSIAETQTSGAESFTDPGIGRPAEDAAISRGMDDATRKELYGDEVGRLFVPADGSTPQIAPSRTELVFATDEDQKHYEAIVARAVTKESPVTDRAIVAPGAGATDPGGVVSYATVNPSGDTGPSPAEQELSGSKKTTRRSSSSRSGSKKKTKKSGGGS